MSEAPMRRRRLRRIGLVVCLSGYTLLTSCFTSGLWSDSFVSVSYDPDTGEPQVETDVVAKLCLTPLTLLLDVVTCPIQAALLGSGGDDPAPQPQEHAPAPRQPRSEPAPTSDRPRLVPRQRRGSASDRG